MTADQIKKRTEQLAAAAPFAELEEAAAEMKSYVDAISTEARIAAGCLLGERTHPLMVGGLHKTILENHAKLIRRLNEAVDRVMRTPQMDQAAARAECAIGAGIGPQQQFTGDNRGQGDGPGPGRGDL